MLWPLTGQARPADPDTAAPPPATLPGASAPGAPNPSGPPAASPALPGQAEAGNIRAAAPPTIVERALQQILVERDLDQARALLSQALPAALNQVSNPTWTARIYALLAAISALEGDDAQARRLALRAVTIDQAVRLEPQLGEGAQAVLAAARRDWRALPEDAAVSLLELTPQLKAYLDGIPLPAPGTRAVRAGDHLLQIEGAIGVVARNWFTVAAGQALEEPPPMPEVRAALAPRPKPATAMAPGELETLLEKAREAQARTDALVTGLEVELEAARAARQAARAACLAAQQLELERIQKAASAYNERLQRALNQEDAEEIRHLFRMIGLARDEAVRQQEEVDQCLDQPERAAPPEVRILQSPAGPPLDPARPGAGASSLELRVPLSPVPEQDPGHYLLRPPPADLWAMPAVWSAARSTTPAGGATGGRPPGLEGRGGAGVHAGVAIDAVYDTNPERATPAQQAGVTGQNLEPLLGVLVMPELSLEGRGGFLRGRYPLLLGPFDRRFSDFEAVGFARLIDPKRPTAPEVGVGGALRGDTFPVDALGGGFGEVHRKMGEARLMFASRAGAGALQVDASAEGRLEQYEQLSSGARLLRYGGGGGVGLFWRVFPFSVAAADMAVGWTERLAAAPGPGAASWSGGEGSGWFARARVGGEGQVAPGVTLEGRVGYQLMVPGAGAASALLEQGWIGFARVTVARGPVWCWLELDRDLTPVFFADAALFQGGRLGIRTHGGGRVGAKAGFAFGTERYYQVPVDQAITGSAGWWPRQPYLSGELETSVLLGDSRFSPTVRLRYAASARKGVGGSGDAGNAGPSTTMVVHQVLLGTELGF